MAAYIRRARTASGAAAVQIAAKEGRRHKVVEHLGSAHTDRDLAALLQVARDKLHEGQQQLDLGLGIQANAGPPVGATSLITAKRSRWLIEGIETAWRRLDFDCVGDEAFFHLVLARIVEPTSLRDAPRVIGELGMTPAHWGTPPTPIHAAT